MTDEAHAYDFWFASLRWRADPSRGSAPDFDKRYPETGFYRGQRNEAVAIWWRYDKSGQRAECLAAVHRPDREVPTYYDRADFIGETVFAYCCRHPIEKAEFDVFVKTRKWPDTVADHRPKPEPTKPEPPGPKPAQEHEAPASQPTAPVEAGEGTTGRTDAPPPAGHNQPGDTFTALVAELDALLLDIKQWLDKIGGKIAAQDQADKAANFKVAFDRLQKRVETAKEVEKRPILDAANEIEARFKTLLHKDSKGVAVGKIDRAKDRLKTLLKPWLDDQAAKVEAQRSARQAEVSKAKEEGRRLPPKDPETSIAAGTQGRVSLRSQVKYEIKDIKAAAAFLASMDPQPPIDFTEAVRMCAGRLIKAGQAVPGVETISEDVVA